MGKIGKMDRTAWSKMKTVLWAGQLRAAGLFLVGKRSLWGFFSTLSGHQVRPSFGVSSPLKFEFMYFFIMFPYILPYNWKTIKVSKFWYTSSKSWLKNLSNEYIYSEQSTSRSRDICFQSWPFYSPNRPGFFLKFWLWRPIPKNWGQTREFLLWLSLSWGTDNQINHKKTWFGRITSWIYNHPSAHCVL